jgi:UDP-glucose 4-epimerase
MALGEGGVISILIDSALQQKSFTIFGDGKQTRDFIYIDDVVSANVQATKKPINCVVNIGTAIATTLNDTIEQFENIIGFKLSKEHGEERKGDIKDSYLLNDQAKSLLQWNVRVPLSEGLHKTFDYYQKRETK